ncbi:MAG: tripartite tricarboxylate transporter TctB family protein [Rhodobacteraceae bacterium]|nr:tripartite tricarboxylate transporter TctB family protein [Paracoccaceae bacterium]
MIHPDDAESDSHREGHSDATPGGAEGQRRPGELVFALVLLAASLVLIWQAWGIGGYRPRAALSWPGAIPLATALIMAGTTVIVAIRTWRQPRTPDETLRIAVFPSQVIVMAVLIVGYGLLLKPLGFLPTSFLFLFVSTFYLAQRGLWFALWVSVLALAVIWLVFRIVFTVLMPPGVVPEAEIIQFFRNLSAGGA